jgi:hypothetical protein
MTNVKKIPLTEGEPRDVEVVFIVPLMRGGNTQGAGNVSVKALSLDTQRYHV